MADYKVYSADSHASEPPELYDRLPQAHRHRAPRIETLGGNRWLTVEGVMVAVLDAPHPLTEREKRREGRGRQDAGFLTPRENGVDIPLRLADQDEDGVSGEVVYPNGMFQVFLAPNPEYQIAMARIINDYYIETLGAYPNRFVPSAVIPMADIDVAIAEAERAAKLGFRALSVPESMPTLPYHRPEYEPFWATVETLGLPLNFHVFTQGDCGVIRPEDKPLPDGLKGSGEDLVTMVVGMAAAMGPLSMLVASGALERHPDLKFVLAECGIGWLAWFLYAMDDVTVSRDVWQEPRLAMKPSEYFKRQGHVTFGDDPVGLANRDFTGVDGLMWGSDYPHDEGTFPRSQEIIEETFRGIPEYEKRKMVGENAANLYGFALN